MDFCLAEVIPFFDFKGEFIKEEKIKNGNINDTFLLSFQEENQQDRFILQRINRNVFRKPEKLMTNIVTILDHLRQKVISSGGDPDREVLSLINTKEGNYIHKSEQGHIWRAYKYIKGTRTYDLVEDPRHFYNAGKAFGRFQKLLRDFPARELYEIIPDFHNTPKRYRTFLKAVEDDPVNRVKEVREEIKFLNNRKDQLSVINDRLETGDLPLRVTHNDTKFNNVLIDDRTGEGICVIDLDTVMPGSALYDFGDAIRSGASTAAEDEPDLAKINLDLELFGHFTRGFLEYIGDFLVIPEIKYLAFSTILITLELGMRFLTDYLNGDVYFKTDYSQHNLVRTRAQFKLATDMEEKYSDMQKIIKKAIPDTLRGKQIN